MSKPTGNVLIGQSGGPTAVINQSLVGLIETLVDDPKIGEVYGAVHGIQGILKDKLVDLRREKRSTLEAVARTPCAALRSVRKKPTREECVQILAALRKHHVRYFFYIGGNDSAETAHILDEIATAEMYDVHLFHVPKTIDNDLRETDHCPGYGSAARFVAQAVMGDNQDNRSLPGIKIDVIMGRNAGWLTAASVLARQHEDDGPHLVYVPEKVFDLDRFAGDVDRVYKARGRCLVALSEGVHGPDGKTLVESKEQDSHGNVQLSGSGALGDLLAHEVKKRLGDKLRVRADTFGYLQRSFAGLASEVDAKEARAVGRFAASEALKGKVRHGSISLVRKKKGEYSISCAVTDLAKVAKLTRPLEEKYIQGENDIAPEFLDYVTPLVGKLPKTARLSDFTVSSY
jgi:6-phosphofructokinase 1